MKQVLIRTAAATTIAAGLAVGAVGISNAADTSNSSDSSSTAAPTPGEKPGGHGRFGPDSAALAKALGVSQADLDKAFAAVRDQLKPPTPPAAGTAPSQADMQQRETALANALAKQLNLDPAKVKAALDQVRAEQRADERSRLDTRLQAAVKAGTLTPADEASVLKAFDAGVLGGPHGGPGGPAPAAPPAA